MKKLITGIFGFLILITCVVLYFLLTNPAQLFVGYIEAEQAFQNLNFKYHLTANKSDIAIYNKIHLPQPIPTPWANAISIDAINNRLITADEYDGRISTYDLKTGQKLLSVSHMVGNKYKDIAYQGFSRGYDVAFDAKHNHIFVVGSSNIDAVIKVYDGTTLAYIATLQMPDGQITNTLGHISIDSKNDKLYVQRMGGIEIFDTNNLKFLSTVTLHPSNPNLKVSFLTFDEQLRSLITVHGWGQYRQCIVIFNADTGNQSGTISACDAADGTYPDTAPVFSLIDAASVDAKNGIIIVLDDDYRTGGAPGYRVQFFDSQTLTRIAGFYSDMDKSIFGPKSVTTNQGLAYIRYDDGYHTGKDYTFVTHVYDLNLIKKAAQDQAN